MLEADREDVFAAQTENVRALEKAWKHINKSVNAAFSCNDLTSAEIHTKLLTQVYCAFAEAVFSKVIHTPNGLTLDEISQVKSKGKRSIVEAWKKCVELSLRKVHGKKSGHVANTQRKIFSLIDAYVYDPSLLRNKVAHGQWCVALNSNNTKVNVDLTNKIKAITIVDLHRYKKAFQSLFRIVEDIIESPNKAHHRDYWIHINEFEASQNDMASWTLEKKINTLKSRRARANNYKGITNA